LRVYDLEIFFMVNPLAKQIRVKKIGVLIRDARQAAGLSVSECAEAIGVSEAIFQSYEMGSEAPSLPELEMLAYSLDIPIEHFWGQISLSEDRGGRDQVPDVQRLTMLRHRIIGAMLRKARMEAGLSQQELSEKTGIADKLITSYELGEQAVPLPELEVLSNALEIPLKDFQDKKGPVGRWATRQELVNDFGQLPADLQRFVCLPVNRPYLELAQRLSEMSVDKLRAVAEGLLEITL
jgi:transcriptional regulator with XRE-family HTH domain